MSSSDAGGVSSSVFWSGRIGLMLLLAVAAWWLYMESRRTGRLARAAADHVRRTERQLAFLRASRALRPVLWAQSAAGVALVVSCVHGAWLLALLAAGVMVTPGLALERLCARRVAALEAQVEPWLSTLATSVRTTPSLADGLAACVRLLPPPMSEELELALREHRLGTPLDTALDHLARRIGSRTVAAATLTLRIARASGGNLPEALASGASSLRELARLEGVVRTKTAEGKAQALVISAVPPPLYLGLRALHPEFFRPLETSLSGYLVFGVAGVLWLLAALSARAILRVDV